jgi:hypothetical protein
MYMNDSSKLVAVVNRSKWIYLSMPGSKSYLD